MVDLLRNSHVDYIHAVLASFRTVSYSFQNLWKVLQAFLLKIILEHVYLINL